MLVSCSCLPWDLSGTHLANSKIHASSFNTAHKCSGCFLILRVNPGPCACKVRVHQFWQPIAFRVLGMTGSLPRSVLSQNKVCPGPHETQSDGLWGPHFVTQAGLRHSTALAPSWRWDSQTALAFGFSIAGRTVLLGLETGAAMLGHQDSSEEASESHVLS